MQLFECLILICAPRSRLIPSSKRRESMFLTRVPHVRIPRAVLHVVLAVSVGLVVCTPPRAAPHAQMVLRCDQTETARRGWNRKLAFEWP